MLSHSIQIKKKKTHQRVSLVLPQRRSYQTGLILKYIFFLIIWSVFFYLWFIDVIHMSIAIDKFM